MTACHVTSAPVPAYAGTGLPATEVARILHRLDPAALQEAGAAHTALGRELDTLAAQLTQESRTLAQHWSGAAARRALAQFQRLHNQTATLAAQATRTGSVLTWLGTQVVPAYRDPASGSQAQQFLTALSSALVRANDALSPEVGTPDPAQLASASSGPISPASSALNNPTVTSDPSNLMSVTSNNPVPLISGRGRSHPSAKPRPVDQDSGLSGGALPLSPTPIDPASLAVAPASATRAPLGALPMAGGVGSQADHERQRDAWAPEDRNPWGLPDTCVPPLIEGA